MRDTSAHGALFGDADQHRIRNTSICPLNLEQAVADTSRHLPLEVASFQCHANVQRSSAAILSNILLYTLPRLVYAVKHYLQKQMR
jgi:hypothetical protein